jgi:uncharacterized membrane protein YidH (DUF202 family)
MVMVVVIIIVIIMVMVIVLGCVSWATRFHIEDRLDLTPRLPSFPLFFRDPPPRYGPLKLKFS